MEKLRDDPRVGETVRVVVHTLGPWPNAQMSDNHWSIYLVLVNNGGSVRMNMKAELQNPKGTLEWSPNLSYTLSNTAIQSWDYKVSSAVTVAKVYGLIMGNRRDQYNMSGGGSGCRWWIYVVVSDLERKGYLTAGTATDLWPKLLFQYSSTGHTKKLDMVKGGFTAASTPAALSSSAGPSSSSAGAPSAASPSTTPAPTRVKVTKYTANGRLCYSWKSGGADERSYADAWSSVQDQNGNALIIHREKNRVSVPP